MPEPIEKGDVENGFYVAYTTLASGGNRGLSGRLSCSSLSWVGSRLHPHSEAREGERGLCIKAKHQVQLSGVFLLTAQGEMTATSLNYFLARHFIKIELDFCGWGYNYCSHPVGA